MSPATIDDRVRAAGQALADLDFGLYDRPELAAWAREYLHGHRGRFEFVVRRFAPCFEGGRVAEIGASPGLLALAMARAGFDVTAFDLDPSQIERLLASAGMPCHRWDIESQDAPAAAGKFDCALLLEVFEHLRIDPLRALQRIRGILKPGGRLIISTPNLYRLRNVLRYLAGGGIGAPPAIEFPRLHERGFFGHIRIYCLRELKGLLELAGLRVVESFTRSTDLQAVLPEIQAREGPLAKCLRRAEHLAEWLLPRGRQFLYIVAVAAPDADAAGGGRT